MVFFGNGQRNQLYRLLKSPLIVDLQLCRREEEEYVDNGPVTMNLIENCHEKVVRDKRIPEIMFDKAILQFLTFQVEVVRQILLERARELKNPVTNHLLLHTKEGTRLSSPNIRFAVIKFVKYIKPEVHYTPKDIRAGFSSYIIRKYIKERNSTGDSRSSWKTLEPLAFKEMMAAVMNTSVEMLEEVYMEATHSSFGTHGMKILRLGNFRCRQTET